MDDATRARIEAESERVANELAKVIGEISALQRSIDDSDVPAEHRPCARGSAMALLAQESAHAFGVDVWRVMLNLRAVIAEAESRMGRRPPPIQPGEVFELLVRSAVAAGLPSRSQPEILKAKAVALIREVLAYAVPKGGTLPEDAEPEPDPREAGCVLAAVMEAIEDGAALVTTSPPGLERSYLRVHDAGGRVQDMHMPRLGVRPGTSRGDTDRPVH